jgi:anti-anti-sigma regulatory factor
MSDYRYFQTQQREGVHIIYLTDPGSDRDAAAAAGRELVAYAEKEKPRRVLISFQSVTELSSPVVARLLHFIKTVKTNGGKVECCDASEGFRTLLGMLGRSLPFDHADKSEAEVLEILKTR